MRLSNVFGCFAASIAVCAGANATVLDASFTETAFATTASGATSMAWAPDGSGRLFVTQKEGRVSIVKNGVVLATPFASESVYTVSECGLLGMAFDPNFVQNGFVYFFETNSSSAQQIVRFTASGDVGTARTVIVGGLPTTGANHDGGALGFGPDGKLYWAVGDNGPAAGADADLSSLAAKVGRANRDGTLPTGNPFADGAGPHNDYIWARGFRNPFTLAFQPATGALWLDVAGSSYEQIFVVPPGSHAGWVQYENNQPAGFITPSVVYGTNHTNTRTLLATGGAVRSGGIATFTTTDAHGYRKGGKVTVAGVANATFNGSGYVLSTPSPSSFTFAQAGASATSGGGSTSALSIGGAVTGGDFWSSSAVPAAYRGNYFFGDFNSGRVERVTLAADNSVSSVDHFATDITQSVDVAPGPDGALYLLTLGGSVRRISYNAAAQGIVAMPLDVRLDEAGRAVVNVRLATAPASSVTVNASLTGDGDLSITSGAALTFTTANWSTPQVVRLQSASDVDGVDDVGSLALASAGLTSENVGVRVTDSGGSGVAAASAPAGSARSSLLLGLVLLAGSLGVLTGRARRLRRSAA